MFLKAIFDKLFKIREDAGRSRADTVPEDEDFDPYEKPFLDHLEDLRITLLKMVGVLGLSAIVAFLFNEQIFRFVVYPVQRAGLAEVVEFLTLSPQEIFILSVKVALFAGVIAAFPFLVYFAGEFILPGLKQQEKKYVVPGVGVGFLLFLIGASFAFFIAVPIAMKFFYDYQQDRLEITNPSLLQAPKTLTIDEVLEKVEAKEETQAPSIEAPMVVEVDSAMRDQIISVMREVITTPVDSKFSVVFDEENGQFIFSNQPVNKTPYRIGEYINLVTRMTLVFGLSFQLPVVVVLLVKLELLTARTMRDTRTYAWVIMLVASAIITPPDVFTLGLLAGPLIILYELCIIIASIMERRRAKTEGEEEAERQRRYTELLTIPTENLQPEQREELAQRQIGIFERVDKGLYEEDADHIPIDPHAKIDWSDDEEDWHEGVEDHEDCEASGELVDINSADLAGLMTLPGVGPKLAQNIVEFRPFYDFDEVLEIPGMGSEKLHKMLDRVQLNDPDEDVE